MSAPGLHQIAKIGTPITASDFRLLNESEKYGLYAEMFRQLSERSAIRTKVCRTDGRCQYAIDHGAEGMGHCPVGKCAMPAEAAPPPLYAGNVFMIDGKPHRTCDCSPSINKCARGLPRTLLTTEFSRCMVPV
jgi:hypothetical protein